MQSDVLDSTALQRLQATLGSEAEFLLPELIDEFNEEAPELLDFARKALAGGNAADLRRAAHTLKSNSATFGAMRLSEYSHQLEELAKQERLEDGVALMDTLQAHLEIACAALQELREQL